MSEKKPSLEDRLRKAGIEPDEMAEMVWRRVKDKVVAMLKDMAKQRAADRQAVLTATLSGLTVNWSDGPGDKIAELAERITAAVMRAEERRMNGTGNGY